MDFWNVAEVLAWIISAALIAWMLADAARVGRDFREDVLLSSREGELELFTEKASHGDEGGPRHG